MLQCDGSFTCHGVGDKVTRENLIGLSICVAYLLKDEGNEG